MIFTALTPIFVLCSGSTAIRVGQ